MSDINPKYQTPLYALVNARFGGRTVGEERVVAVTSTRSVLLQNNPNRVFWAVINEGATDVRLSIDPNISISSGWLLPNNGGVITMFWEEDGESVGNTVFAIANGANTNVRIREVYRL